MSKPVIQFSTDKICLIYILLPSYIVNFFLSGNRAYPGKYVDIMREMEQWKICIEICKLGVSFLFTYSLDGMDNIGFSSSG